MVQCNANASGRRDAPAAELARRFRLERVVGHGGMGTVYRGLDLETGEPVAVKLITKSNTAALERFGRESRMLAELRHPHVVRWIAHGVSDDGDPYLAMEWLEGEDLAQRLVRGPLTVVDAVRLGLRVGDALATVHALGITHRDIKPENIFLQRGQVDDLRVLDFGIARSEQFASMTRTGATLGTVGFMAPEQLSAKGVVGPWSDIFALGCVLFECLTGRLPFSGPQPMAVMLKIMLEDAPRVRELAPWVPAALDELVACMLERDVDQRVGSATELLMALRMIESSPLTSEPRAPRPSLTTDEQRVVSVIVAAPSQAFTAQALAAAVEPFGATLETPDASLVVALLAGEGTTTVQAVRAACCALALRALLPDAPMVLVTGLCVVADRLPVGPLIDRAVGELEAAPRRGVGVDELTARLIAERFELAPDGLVLVGERARASSDRRVERLDDGDARRLLGQATPCVGREREVANLIALFDECVDDEVARAAIVTGPPGLGKTRLVHEVLRALGTRELTLIEDRGDAVAPGVAFGILGRAIRGAAGVVGGEPLAERRARITARVGRDLPASEHAAVIPFIGELAGVPFDEADDVALRSARAAPSLMTSKLEQALVRWLEAECAARPVLVVLEDLHWADGMSVRLVERALERLAERPFMVLATGRPEVFDVFGSLKKIRARHDVVLAGISKKAAQRLVRAAVGDALAPELVARLVERADGNPLFLEELVRHAAEGRADTLPTSLIGIVHARLAELEPDTRRLLRAASILGDTFWAGGVAHLTAERPAVVAARLAELVDDELLERRPVASSHDDEQLGFCHALVREVAYATLTDDDRRLGHRLAAGWLEQTASAEPSTIASHYELGGEPRPAAYWYEAAARAALAVSDLEGALAKARRGLGCDPEASVAIDLHLVAGRTLRWKGELEQASSELGVAFEALPPGSRSWFRAGGDLVNVVSRRELWDVALRVAEAMLTTPCECPEDGSTRAIALARAAHMLLFPRRMALGEPMLHGARAAACALPVDDALVTAHLRAAEGAFGCATADYGAALQASRDAARGFELMGDRATALVEHNSSLVIMSDLGLYADVVAHAPTCIAEATSLGMPFPVAIMRATLGQSLRALGDREGARRELERAVELFAGRHQIAWPRIQLALCALDEGDIDRAEHHAADGAARGRWFTPGRGPNLACLARVALARGHTDEARRRVVEALAFMESDLTVLPHESVVRRAYIEVHDALGDAAAADRQLALTRALVVERAARIADARWRAAYLAIPDHQAILALAQRLGAASPSS